MNKLQKLSDQKLTLSEDQLVNAMGGIKTGGALYGSAWTFEGEVSQTQQTSFVVNTYTDDYCGKATMDGQVKTGCWEHWK